MSNTGFGLICVVGVLVINWGVVRVSWPRVTGGAPRGKPSAGKDYTSFRLSSRESCSRQPLAPVQSVAVKFAYQSIIVLTMLDYFMYRL